MIQFQDISLNYQTSQGQIVILKNVSFTVPSGEWISLIGPSGSGKTTILKIIAGLLKPTEGRVCIQDVNMYELSKVKRHEQLRTKVASVYQQFRLLPQFSAVENIMLPLIPYQKRKELLPRAHSLIEKVGLTQRLHHFPEQLSGGEQQRVAIARALMTEPEILLCDEPTGNLDHSNRDNVLSLLEVLHAEGKTIVLATHDELAATRSNRILALQSGVLEERIMDYDQV
ncbi:ABC transporter ATP-binding protein [Alkalicoccobacillus porphyridii]|uniref:ABC transporter ATP-binding protein n=1 Tax=Alkalicoccobacillus porphyridii TaxID=2597270 RepID=A0A554A1S4_9BACI|nr:ABC transporter ATP-binding protein [Alkalicoccobacillus porphyridii]TSB47648.1 ABC transporter ATP-binding protein [Alkalicoccobacillus porphyridii]